MSDEPRRFTAGDSVAWSRSASEYTPADGWALRYVLISAHRRITIEADVNAAATGWVVALTGAETRGFQPGPYRLTAYAWKDDDRYTLHQSELIIDPNLEVQDAGIDLRTALQRHLDALYTARNAMVGGALHATVSSESIGGRSRTFRSLDELDSAITRARRDVNREDSARRLRAGQGHPGRVKVTL
jgi:hypothetical protein